MNWRDLVTPAGDIIKTAARYLGGPIAGLIADAGVDLAHMGLDAVDNGLSRDAIIQQVDDRIVDLLRALKNAP